MTQLFGLEELPVIIGDAVAQAKALKKIPLIQRNGLLQGFQASGADLLLWVVMGLPGTHQAGELVHVQPELCLRVRAHCLAVHDQPLSLQRASQQRQVAAQYRPGAARLQLRPQQRDQAVAAQPRALCAQAGYGHIGHEGQDLARIEL